MNYISKLQEENKELKKKLDKLNNYLTDFTLFLQTSPKFQSTQNERKDWIATGDVIRTISEIKQVILSE